MVEPVRRTKECYRLEQGGARGIAEGALDWVRDDIDGFHTVVTDDI